MPRSFNTTFKFSLRLTVHSLFFVSLLFVLGCGSANENDNGGGFAGFNTNSGSGTSFGAASSDTSGAKVVEPTPTPSVSGQTSSTSSGSSSSQPNVSSVTISRFLWKPKSERNGNLVVLVDPTRIRVEVMGSISETLDDDGPSNGRGTTARSNFTGCDFGSNVRVEFYDRNNRRVLLSNGRSAVVVSNGCDRAEFDL